MLLRFLKSNLHIAAVTGIMAFGGLTAVIEVAQPDPITVQLQNPQQISWTKPTTDAGWAEDVKAENLDIKSTDVLQQMLSSLSNSLTEQTTSIMRYQDCPACVQYDLKTDNPTWTQQDIDNAFNNDLSSRQWNIEKLTQSIERIEHELDLRSRGIVVADKLDIKGTPAKKTDLQKVAPAMVRKIND